MSIGDRTPKKLSQSALTTSLAAQVTGAATMRTQVTQIWLANTNAATTRTIVLTAYGVAAANQIQSGIVIPAASGVIIDSKLVLLTGEILYAKQDVGTDVTMTVYGVEEQTS